MMPALPLLKQLQLQLLDVWSIACSATQHDFPALENLRDWHSNACWLQLHDGSACGQLAITPR
jgi:hypothetical protein